MRLKACWAVAAIALSTTVGAQSSSNSTSAPAAQSTVCGDIIRKVDNKTHPTREFDASTVHECLNSVPFNPAVATRFLKYVNDSIRFQSSLGWIKNPPPGYLRRGIDLVAGINQMQDLTSKGAYSSHYEFEDHLNILMSSAHDNHLKMFTFGASAFRFLSPRKLVTFSRDGKALPRLYLVDDASDFYHGHYPKNSEPSPIKTINGKPAEQYLEEFSDRHADGNLDPHADWNELMYHPYLELQSRDELFTASTSYPGDSITFVLDNGTQIGPERFRAVYTNTIPTGPLETGGDFFNFFVLGNFPDNFDPVESDTSYYQVTSANADNPRIYADESISDADPIETGASGTVAYDLTREGFKNYSVLVIPGFDATGYDISTFAQALYRFTNDTLAENEHRVLIDLQQNAGGSPILAIDAFRHFFPKSTIEPSFRMRAHEYANTIGTQFSAYWQDVGYNAWSDDFYLLAPSMWVAQTRIDPRTGRNFTSWSDFYGPRLANGDFVTNTQRYNVSDPTFTTFTQNHPSDFFTVFGSKNDNSTLTQPFNAEDIVILTDGLCNSACALFVELMHYYAGVKTITIGGKPQYGPMQTAGRSRGGSRYGLDTLDLAFNNTLEISKDIIPASVNLPERQPNVVLYAPAVNALDVMREGSDTPLQFTFDAADCRIFHTPATIFDYAEVWYAAINATWMDTSLCVQGSTGFSTRKGKPAAEPAPALPLQGPLTFQNISTEIGERIDDSLKNLTDEGLESSGIPLFNRLPTQRFPEDFFTGIRQNGGNVTKEYCAKHNLYHVPFRTSFGLYLCSTKCVDSRDCQSTSDITTSTCQKGLPKNTDGIAGGGSSGYRLGNCKLDLYSVERAYRRN